MFDWSCERELIFKLSCCFILSARKLCDEYSKHFQFLCMAKDVLFSNWRDV
ncbi:hypothetical protein Syun_004999 [Stephania yunnanensis]|uniref:Uncharacterized protein n=1 Tax=Stephania yunnanensis TaxID=152371 RepID=A0AAP0L3Z1_9MAGN